MLSYCVICTMGWVVRDNGAWAVTKKAFETLAGGELESRTLTENADKPVKVGVPDSTPVLASRDNPAGGPVIDHWSAPCPPMATRVVE